MPGVLFGGDRKGFFYKFNEATGEEDPTAEAWKRMSAVLVPFDIFDALVETFAGPVALMVFPGVLDIGAVVADGIDAAAGARAFGRGIRTDPFREGFPPQAEQGHAEDRVEGLEGIVGLPEVIGKLVIQKSV